MPAKSHTSWHTIPFLLVILASLCVGGRQTLTTQAAGLPPGTTPVATSVPTMVEGRLVPARFVSMSNPGGERVAQVPVLEGQQVHAGDLLVRLDGYEQSAAQVASAELEVVLARQAVDALYDHAALKLAEIEQSIAITEKEQALAEDGYKSINKPKSQSMIEQAYANLKLAEHQLQDAQDDLEKAQKRFDNKKNLIWLFINQRQFKLRITLLEQNVADFERRYQDAKETYDDALKPPDEIDVALARTRLDQINASLNRLEVQRDELATGPDPDDLQAAQARLKSAEASLASAELALKSSQITAPIDGLLVQLNAKPGEWLPTAAPVAVVADLSQWKVEAKKVAEALVPQIQVGGPVRLQFNAIPDLSLAGRVDSIDLLYTEEDGDIYYTTKIHAEQNDPRLRWGMTVQIEFLSQ